MRQINPSAYYLATLAGVMAILLWASNIAFSKNALDMAGTYNGAFYIYFCSGLLLFCIMLVFQRKTNFIARLKNLPSSYYFKTGIFFIFNNVLLFLALGLARKNEELIIVTLLNYTWPVMIYVLRIPIFRLKTPMGIFIPGVLLSISGIVLALLQDYDWKSLGMLINARDENVPAYLLAVLTSVSWALYSNLTMKYKNEDDMAAIPVIFMVSGLIFLGIQAVNGQLSTLKLSAATFSPDLLYTIIGPTSLGYFCWYIALKNGNRTLITALSFFIPVLSLVFLRIRVNLEISPVFWIAVILLISGSYLCYRALRSSTLHSKPGDHSRN